MLGFVLEPAYNNIRNFRALLAAFLQDLDRLIDDGALLKKVIARGLTPDGQNLCEGIGMTPVRQHESKGHIYELDFSNPERIPRSVKPLYDHIERVRGK
jgi:hypothetical protein